MRPPLSLLLFCLLVATLVLAGCEPGPRDLRYGDEECAHCMMRVTDRPFGSQLVTEHGRTYAFDSVECLAAHVEDEEIAAEDVHSIWVPNFADPEGDWLQAQAAVYLQSDNLPSPMGMSLTAYSDRASAEEHQAEHGGTLHDWNEVRALVRTDWLTHSGHSQ